MPTGMSLPSFTSAATRLGAERGIHSLRHRAPGVDCRVVFTKRLREGVRRGLITSSIRVWTRPHVKVGGRYRMDEGEIEVDSIRAISRAQITPGLARRSGFKDVVELLKIAKHGSGENIYLIRFHYSPSFLPRVVNSPGRRRAAPRGVAGRDTR